MSPLRARSRRALLVPAVLAASLAAPVTSPAPAAADDADGRFTFVVLPDTQGYTADAALAPTMTAQTRWIADHRDDLDIAYVAQVGDLVESHPNVEQWQRASEGMKVLDDAGVPSAVLPGNHDMDVTTGEAPRFDEHFPASRYPGAVSTFRGARNSAALFTAGGQDLLLLSLEYDPRDDVLAWARGVLAEHPQRRAILSTHSFVHTAGGRSSTTTRTDGGNTPAQVWDELVRPSCSIFLVVNGHWHDGDLGEARRTDANDCGRPVHQVLSNYQERINGGDGWLRYYEVDTQAGTMQARTWSPTLDRFETDADSEFVLSYPTTPPPTTTPTTLVASGSDWRYRFSATTLPTTWNAVGFDDSAWTNGRATLGFGPTGIATNIDVPAPTTNRPRSAHLRRTFTVEDPSRLSDLVLTTRADDGVALFLNGTELKRVNLPTGTLTKDTYATAAPSTRAATTTPVTFAVPATALRAGTNTLAASVHLNYRSTPDLSYDLSLTGKVVPAG